MNIDYDYVRILLEALNSCLFLSSCGARGYNWTLQKASLVWRILSALLTARMRSITMNAKSFSEWSSTFESRLRSAVLFANRISNAIDVSSQNHEINLADFPAVKKASNLRAPSSKNPHLDSFLNSIKPKLFDRNLVRKVHDSLCPGERSAPRKLKSITDIHISIQD